MFDSIKIVESRPVLLNHFFHLLQTKSVCLEHQELKKNSKNVLLVTISDKSQLKHLSLIVSKYLSFLKDIDLQIIYFDTTDTLFVLSESGNSAETIEYQANELMNYFVSCLNIDNI